MAKKQERQEPLHTNTPPSPPPPTHTHTLHNSSKNLHHQLYPNLLPSLSSTKKNIYMAKKEERERERERDRERERERERERKDKERQRETERRQRTTEEPKPKPQILSIFHSFPFGRKKKTSPTAPTTTTIKLPVCRQFLSFQNFFEITSTFQHGLPMSSSGNVGRKGIYFTKRNGKSVLKRRDN